MGVDTTQRHRIRGRHHTVEPDGGVVRWSHVPARPGRVMTHPRAEYLAVVRMWPDCPVEDGEPLVLVTSSMVVLVQVEDVLDVDEESALASVEIVASRRRPASRSPVPHPTRW